MYNVQYVHCTPGTENIGTKLSPTCFKRSLDNARLLSRCRDVYFVFYKYCIFFVANKYIEYLYLNLQIRGPKLESQPPGNAMGIENRV